MSDPKVGDEVTWNTPQGETHGKVVEKKTKDFQLAKQHFTASDDKPMFVVESGKSGHRAAHKGDALTVKN
jgi:surface antigen